MQSALICQLDYVAYEFNLHATSFTSIFSSNTLSFYGGFFDAIRTACISYYAA